MILLRTENLGKRYNGTSAMKSVSISIKKGDIYALIGKNGAGKTTLMKIVTGLIKPSEGTVEFVNIDKNDIGVLIELPGLLLNLSAYDNLKAKCILRGITDKEYILNLLDLVGLKDVKQKKVKKFSLGMKQRLGLALALVGDPLLLVLDEPINGLDPQGIAEFRNILVKLNEEKNITIMISSHVLEELSKIATAYTFIDNGVVVNEISSGDLMKKCKKDKISMEEYYFSVIKQ